MGTGDAFCSHVDQRILVVAIEQGCLAQQVMVANILHCNHDNDQAGVSPGDIIDEFGGHVLYNPPQGKVTCASSAVMVITEMIL